MKKKLLPIILSSFLLLNFNKSQAMEELFVFFGIFVFSTAIGIWTGKSLCNAGSLVGNLFI